MFFSPFMMVEQYNMLVYFYAKFQNNQMFVPFVYGANTDCPLHRALFVVCHIYPKRIQMQIKTIRYHNPLVEQD